MIKNNQIFRLATLVIIERDLRHLREMVEIDLSHNFKVRNLKLVEIVKLVQMLFHQKDLLWTAKMQ